MLYLQAAQKLGGIVAAAGVNDSCALKKVDIDTGASAKRSHIHDICTYFYLIQLLSCDAVPS